MMSGVVLVMLVIFLIIAFTLMYLAIYFEFDETTFTKRLQVLTEYVKRTNAYEPTPDVIGYVSDIMQNTYIVTWFKTVDMSDYHNSVHDDQIETFDFLDQKFKPVDRIVHDRVRTNDENPNEFILAGDDADVTMKCPPYFNFDYAQLKCVPVLPCDNKSAGLYPMNERLIDTLMLNQHLDKDYSSNSHLYHPTFYLRCFANGAHVVEECPDNYTFDAETGQCKVNELCKNRPDGYILSYFPSDLLVNQFMQCVNGRHVVGECSANKIFDRNLMSCVEAHPCAFNGEGHTYITADIGDTQYFKCLNNNESQLITCINRVRDSDNQYKCSGDSRCINLPNGTGQHVFKHVDENVSYNIGQLVCDNFEVISDIKCDSSNVFDNKLFMNKFRLNIEFPTEVFENNACVPSTVDNVNFLSSTFDIENIPNHYGINMQTSMLGMTEMIKHLISGDLSSGEDEVFAQWLLYAKDKDAIGLNPFTGEPIDCFGNNLYDVFDAKRANICDDSGTSVLKTLNFGDGEFLNVLSDTLTGKDEDYLQYCALSYENGQKIVKSEHFKRRILTNILQSDVCANIYTTLYQKYTTLASKYTTTPFQYNDTFVKRSKNMEVYEVNTRFKNATILKNATDIPPLFNPFQNQPKNKQNDSILPLFNPFQTTDVVWYSEPGGEDDHWIVPPPVESTPTPEPSPSPEPGPPSPPPLILEDKDLFYSCHYSVPFFKMTSCHAKNDVIVDALNELRNNVQVDMDCESAKNLSHVLNAYAYVGDGIGCRSAYDGNAIVVKKETAPSHVYSNLNTQSNDGVKYNRWLHVKNGQYMACPEELYDNNEFKCNVEMDKLYYLNNLQEDHIV
ncbi:p95 [Maruca vitrata nucleopolyhedrovirus]|uniref:p95 n=1 Tax=Maruca vitrata nucleopolyhedrovirus TaxID=1307954 RepID=A1YRC8_9ABAC|nr:p95 [Maruca vitrata nucleopolyhedrovirus]ABL76018.1 p95 [Maruca vitrata nucleopolyhedrovirus]